MLATARWYQLAARTAHELGLVDPVVACSGAEVRRLTDGKGRTVDFTNTVLIMTSNVGSQDIAGEQIDEQMREKIDAVLTH